ncbi:NUDIX domain-containing protein [Cereibacter azotoformans]|uniref:NUDIX hydrolase n=1 Tax=Cereibacter sphaeroides (strain ATCC 17025 / ATH 2.4.3) TaxID=349102 RepID=A4WV18_CERS5|nr:NUDIX domain-containing protein [Cereibacter azotoformans]ULB10447.1 NUDIX domain-containing protein [Cereibacter azotoformans]
MDLAAEPAADDKTRIRPAATVILLRDGASGPQVLMGMRGAAAAFMPSKFVFPGGAVDAVDADVPLAALPAPDCLRRLGQDAPGASALAAAAIRELWEETGLPLGLSGRWEAPQGWRGFAARGLVPDGSALRFVFRAITPPGRPRRFDARFFLADAARLAGDPEDFSAACDELSHLQWLPLAQARRLDLPFITEVVLAEVSALLASGEGGAGVPFFDNSGPVPTFRRLV